MQENSVTSVPQTATVNAVATSPVTPSNMSDFDQAQFEADKRAVYK
jgi:hypothetical protein